MPDPEPISHLRQLSASEWEDLGQQSLRDHLQAQAVVAHHKYSPLTLESLERLLHDPECVRHPTRQIFEFGEMAMHQFAQPDHDVRDPEGRGRVLYLRPGLRDRADLVVLAVAYMIPVINYGDIISDDHCLLYGASLLGLMEDEFYRQICILADGVGVELKGAGECGAC